MDFDDIEKNLSTPISSLVRELGHAKRSELMKNGSQVGGVTCEKPKSTAVRADGWTEKEDFNIFRSVRKYKEDWDKIASVVKTRTAEECKTRWNNLESRRLSKLNAKKAKEAATKKNEGNVVKKKKEGDAVNKTNSGTFGSVNNLFNNTNFDLFIKDGDFANSNNNINPLLIHDINMKLDSSIMMDSSVLGFNTGNVQSIQASSTQTDPNFDYNSLLINNEPAENKNVTDSINMTKSLSGTTAPLNNIQTPLFQDQSFNDIMNLNPLLNGGYGDNQGLSSLLNVQNLGGNHNSLNNLTDPLYSQLQRLPSLNDVPNSNPQNGNPLDISSLVGQNLPNPYGINSLASLGLNNYGVNSVNNMFADLLQHPHGLQLWHTYLILSQRKPDSKEKAITILQKLIDDLKDPQKEYLDETDNDLNIHVYSNGKFKKNKDKKIRKGNNQKDNEYEDNDQEDGYQDDNKKLAIRKDEEEAMLYHQLSTYDFPDEMEEDNDFSSNERDDDSETNDSPEMRAEELENLLEEESNIQINQEIQNSTWMHAKEENGLLFGANCLNLLRKQMQKNMQIVVQAYTIESTFRGADSENARYWKDQILHIKRLNDYGQSKTRTKLNTPIDESDQGRDYFSFFTIPGAQYLESIISMINSYMLPPEGNTQNKPGNGSKCVDEIEYPKATYCVAGSAKQKVEKFTIIGQICHKILNPIFFKELLPYFDPVQKRTRHIFTPVEDRLLTIGLHKFGDDFPSIRSQILTPRTSKQLENRFNNLKCRRTAFNPVQDYYLRQIKPLTVEEEELLNAGVKHYGKKFKLISQRIIPQRPPFLLRKAWKDMEQRKNTPYRPEYIEKLQNV